MIINIFHRFNHKFSDKDTSYYYGIEVDGKNYCGSSYEVDPHYNRKTIFLWYQDFNNGKNIQEAKHKQVNNIKEAKQFIADNINFLQNGN